MTSRRWWLVGAAAALALLIAGVWFWVASTRSSTPEEAALAYLHALESGDPERVAATGAAVPEPALEAFAAATALIQDAEVTHRADGGPPASASVDIGFHLEGEEHTARLTLESVDGRWVVDESGLGTVTADSAIGTHVAVGTASAARPWTHDCARRPRRPRRSSWMRTSRPARSPRTRRRRGAGSGSRGARSSAR
nr:hypothetical protein [Microbacterium barkeri]